MKNDRKGFVRGQSEDSRENRERESMKLRLLNYIDLNREIDNQIERLERMHDRAQSPSGPNLSGMQKSSNAVSDRMADAVTKMLTLEEEIGDLIEKRDNEQKGIEALVKKLKKADEKAVIRMRYLDIEDWDDVQFMLFGSREDYNEKYENYKQRMFRLHSSAITHLSILQRSQL